MGLLETAIRDTVLADNAIAAVVGSRLRPLGLSPGEARPYLTYEITDRKSLPTLADGVLEYRTGEFEIGVHADTYAGVMTLSEMVRDRLDQFGGTVAGVELDASFDGESDVAEAVPEGEEKPIYLRVMTFTCLYRSA